MMHRSHFYALLALPALTLSQTLSSLRNALDDHQDASTFATYLGTNPPALASLLNPNTSTTGISKYTILVPSNNALTTYQTSTGKSLTSLPASDLSIILKYHVLVAPLTETNFTVERGITVPTLLTDEQYNNRSAGDQLARAFGARAASGQVLYFSSEEIASTSAASSVFKSKRRVLVRQANAGAVNLRAGAGEIASVDVVDGTWDGGNFQIVSSILQPPLPCSRTIRPVEQLSALDTALNRTQLWATLDRAPNVTCLAPNTQAFAAAGNPQNTLNQSDLAQAILFHTLPQPLYTNFLQDGQEITSLGNLTVRITVNSTGTYFNDARVLAQNVLTNNGVVHILDKVMTPLSRSQTSNPPPSGSSGAPSAATTTGAGSAVGVSAFGALAVAGLGAALLI
jgi:transforming growth factor-beta-induced protein